MINIGLIQKSGIEIMSDKSVRLGVDIGGTFTDVVLEISGVSHSAKVLTTYIAPENAIIDGMTQVCSKARVSPSHHNADNSWNNFSNECIN
jgi:hypothetical protein